ncbi:hypothetical protein PTZ02_15735 [Clostridium sp. 'White wine YQ']|nr:hypothetical protein [Clostridium sp. 'White wine YQ']
MAILLVNLEEENTVGKDDKVVINICSSGQGTAKKFPKSIKKRFNTVSKQ